VVLGYVASMLAEYEARKAANFLEKDAAIALLIAAAVKTQVTSLGGALRARAGMGAGVAAVGERSCARRRSCAARADAQASRNPQP